MPQKPLRSSHIYESFALQTEQVSQFALPVLSSDERKLDRSWHIRVQVLPEATRQQRHTAMHYRFTIIYSTGGQRKKTFE
jgi:hypothetical protein